MALPPNIAADMQRKAFVHQARLDVGTAVLSSLAAIDYEQARIAQEINQKETGELGPLNLRPNEISQATGIYTDTFLRMAGVLPPLPQPPQESGSNAPPSA